MRIGILIIGSLLWDNCKRKAWRRCHLALDRAVPVRAQIRYGRLSQSRGNTFTMTINTDGDAGRALVVPCRTTQTGVSALFAEAEALWQAEQSSAAAGSISTSWGCVGVRFRDEPAPTDWSTSWAEYFCAKKATPIPPVNDNGLLDISWPSAVADGPADVDVLLATATKAEKKRPSPEDIADAWVDQKDDHERYFFENVRHGIRTPDDVQIWHRIEERKPKWMSRDEYAEAIAILRAESQ